MNIIGRQGVRMVDFIFALLFFISWPIMNVFPFYNWLILNEKYDIYVVERFQISTRIYRRLVLAVAILFTFAGILEITCFGRV